MFVREIRDCNIFWSACTWLGRPSFLACCIGIKFVDSVGLYVLDLVAHIPFILLFIELFFFRFVSPSCRCPAFRSFYWYEACFSPSCLAQNMAVFADFGISRYYVGVSGYFMAIMSWRVTSHVLSRSTMFHYSIT